MSCTATLIVRHLSWPFQWTDADTLTVQTGGGRQSETDCDLVTLPPVQQMGTFCTLCIKWVKNGGVECWDLKVHTGADSWINIWSCQTLRQSVEMWLIQVLNGRISSYWTFMNFISNVTYHVTSKTGHVVVPLVVLCLLPRCVLSCSKKIEHQQTMTGVSLYSLFINPCTHMSGAGGFQRAGGGGAGILLKKKKNANTVELESTQTCMMQSSSVC